MRPMTLTSRYRVLLACIGVGMCAGSVAASPRDSRTAEQVTFPSGNIVLAGTLYLPPSGGRHAAVVVLHASGGGTRDYHAYQHLVQQLPPTGFAVLLFDRRGEGASGGTAGTASFAELAADGVAAVAYLKSRPDIDASRIGVWGISQGGWLAPLAATMSQDIAFVVAVSAPGVTPARQMDYSATYALRAAGQPSTVIDRAVRARAALNDYFRGRVSRGDAEQAISAVEKEPWFGLIFLPSSARLPLDPKHNQWYSVMDYDPIATVARVTVPMAFFFAEDDAYVPVEESMARVRATARVSDILIQQVPGTDHYMETGASGSGGPTSPVYVQQLLDWLRKHHTVAARESR
jgi:dienelactone hydrolase